MSLQVIGAGFGRTGTMSLKAALELLGLNPCYHMVECFPRGPAHWARWTQALNGSADWDAIFDGFAATVDFPACTSYRALADHYPNAKIVLTVRDPESWYRSTQETIFSPPWMEWLATSEAAAFMNATVNDYFNNRMHDREYLIARFNQHVAEVKAAIPSERLLVYEVKQGWAPLCEFLSRPVPDEAFPHINDTEATREIIHAIMQNGFARVFGF